MARTISATEAKAKLSSVIDWAVQNKDEVIVESRGNPKAVIMSYDAYTEFMALREQERRQAALAKLEQLAATVQARNKDLSQEDAEALADRFTREVISDMAKSGEVAYKQKE